MLVDDAQWLDAESADVIAYAARRIGGRNVRGRRRRAVARPASETGEAPGRTVRAGPGAPRWRRRPVVEMPVPPLAAHDVAELLELYSLPARAASKLHADSGGNPYLALALGGAFADRTLGHLAARRRCPGASTPCSVTAPTGCPPRSGRPCCIAALATRPTVELLLRAGRAEAERDIRLAAATEGCWSPTAAGSGSPRRRRRRSWPSRPRPRTARLSTPHSPQW